MVPLGLGALLGGTLGPRLMRGAPRGILRVAIAILALALGAWLLAQALLQTRP